MNKKRFIWLVPVLLMAFAISACKSDDDDGGTRETLSWSGKQVYNTDGTLYTGGNAAFVSSAGGSGTINGGKMSFSISTPNSQKSMTTLLVELDVRYGHNVFSYAGYDPANTQAMDLAFTNLRKKINKTTAASITKEEIYYIYVDRDCIVTATGIPSITTDGDIPVKVPNYTLKLKKGWNPVGMILAANTTSGTLIIGTGDSDSCEWVFE